APRAFGGDLRDRCASSDLRFGIIRRRDAGGRLHGDPLQIRRWRCFPYDRFVLVRECVDMTGPRFCHLDDLKWHEVRRQQQGERVMSVREKWMEFSDRYLSLYARWDPGMSVQPH